MQSLNMRAPQVDIPPGAMAHKGIRRKARANAFVASAEKQAGFAALYVIGPRWLPGRAVPHGYEHWPCKVGVTTQPRTVVASCRQWNHTKINLTALYWTLSPQLARRLKKLMEEHLKADGAHHHGGWYDRDPDMLEMELRHLAEQHKIELFDETERQGRIDQIVARKVGGHPKRMN